jgi:hypothetical protein
MSEQIPVLNLPAPAGPAPRRQPRSVRRTSSIDMTWPRGRRQSMDFHGVARDIFTPATGAPVTVIRQDEMRATIAPDRTIEAIAALPERPGIAALVGVKGGGYLRQALNGALPQEQADGTPLYLLIDDISGSSLIAGWAWSRWPDNSILDEEVRARHAALRSQMEGICIGFRPGSRALDEDFGSADVHKAAPVVPLAHPEDPDGWHDLTVHSAVSMRRARRIDVWIDGEVIIDAAFQDSASAPAGGRIAVHEYGLRVTAATDTLLITSIVATPHVLPYDECPAAIGNIGRLVGRPLAELRTLVLEELPRQLGCTHLNDAMRALAEVPALLACLDRCGAAPA